MEMHIGFLTPEYPHSKVNSSAGIGTTIKNLAQSLLKQNVQVTVFVFGQSTQEIINDDGIVIHLIAQKKMGLLTWYRYRKYLENYVNQHAKSNSIDLIEAPDWTGITAFMKLDVPLVIRLHGTDAYFCKLENRRQKVKNYFFEKQALKTAQAYISPTQFAAQKTAEIFSIDVQQIKIIPSGILLDQFENNNSEQYQAGVILYLGTIIRKKGVLELPHIFENVLEQCPNAELIIVGRDAFDIKTKCESTWLLLQNTLNGRLFSKVKYLGSVPYEKVQEYIRQANVCIFPTFAETQGMVTIESMAMQKAVVNSNIGWAHEILNDGSEGFLAHPKDHSAFADKIIQLINQPELAFQIGQAARKRVEADFDIEKLVQRNIHFYQSVIQQNIQK